MQIKMSSKTHSSGQLMGKPLDLSCMIKLSVVQLDSKSVQSSILDRSYELLLEYFVVHSHRISFPECSLPTLIELRKIAKETQFSWFKRQIKQLIEKVEAVSSEVERSRSSVQFAPKDLQQVGIWERERKGQPNGLKTFLLSWKQIHQKQMNHEQEAAESSTSTKEKDVQRKSGNMQAKKKNEIGVPKPGLKKKAQPGLKKKAQPGLKKKAQPGLKKKAQPGLKKKAQPSLKKEDQPSLKKKDQSGLKKKTQPEEDIVTDMFPL
jgi:predicted transcriptional regulator